LATRLSTDRVERQQDRLFAIVERVSASTVAVQIDESRNEPVAVDVDSFTGIWQQPTGTGGDDRVTVDQHPEVVDLAFSVELARAVE
jgi:hypothetical protein